MRDETPKLGQPSTARLSALTSQDAHHEDWHRSAEVGARYEARTDPLPAGEAGGRGGHGRDLAPAVGDDVAEASQCRSSQIEENDALGEDLEGQRKWRDEVDARGEGTSR